MDHLKDYYTILGIPKSSDAAAIKTAYQKLAVQMHPDKLQQMGFAGTGLYEESVAEFKEIQEAYDVLKDQAKRSEYDAEVEKRKYRQEFPVSEEVLLDDMNFDEETELFSWPCRCSGEYVVLEEDLTETENIVCCSDCSLAIRVIVEEDID
eukprot:Colp12_sorted_trinity150504_noHs@7700